MGINTIVTVATSNYKEYLYAFLESMKVNLKGAYKIIIIHERLGKDIVSKAKDIAKNCFDILFYNIRGYSGRKAFGKLLDNPAYWRLIAPYIVGQAGTFLYIDLDTLALEDFSELFSYDLKSKTVGACVDYLKKIKIGVSNWEELQLNPNKSYFNSGVLLIDVKRYRTNEITKKVIKIVKDNEEHLVAGGKWPQNDQYGLNVALYEDWLILPGCYNYGSELEFKPCKILHFIGNGKPSSRTCKPEYKLEFFKYLEKSHY